ncbi:MAG: tryptophan synthase subunit alpha [Fuerstiella sp.]|jgi:tryptophan synthase alpha chain|nr:tryptophan synthase subunit alpha [Fuerstiella sp.]MDG2128451.1 tryptophan synthase subunit alpha [Fuerstiella sp.]
MSRISDVFDQAAQQARMTFMPFVTAGDPSLQSTSAVLKGLRDADVDLIELGFPYSDPIADGPVIQASYTRALDNDVTVHGILGMMEDLRDAGLPPVLAMVSYAIVFRFGTDAFVARAAEVGFSGLIIPDLPADEASEMSATATKHGLGLVQLIAPTTTSDRTQQILDASSGFVYCVSVAGTTGVRKELPEALIEQLMQLRLMTDLPLAVGFGISGPDQVASLEGVADGVIVGSAIVRLAAEAPSVEAAAAAVRTFSSEMRAAVNGVKPSRRI